MHTTLIDAWLPQRRAALDLLVLLGASLAIGLGAQVAIPLPFTPVPATLQTLAVLVTGAVLGSKRGALAVLVYLAEGAAGLPVFAGGLSGPTMLLGPTGGYLVGFVVAAFVVGLLAERGWDRRRWTTLAAMVIGTAIILGLGVVGLCRFMPLSAAIAAGAVPFVLGDIIKIALAMEALPRAWPRRVTR